MMMANEYDNNEPADEKDILTSLMKYGIIKTKIKIVEQKIIWMMKNLFFIDYILQNISKHESETEYFIIDELMDEIREWVISNENKINYDAIDYNIKLFDPFRTVDYINSNKLDELFIEESFNSPYYNELYFRKCEELTNILFGKKLYNKFLGLSLDDLISQISFYYIRVEGMKKVSLNPENLHLTELLKFNIKESLKEYFKIELKKGFKDFESEYDKNLKEVEITDEDIEEFNISPENLSIADSAMTEEEEKEEEKEEEEAEENNELDIEDKKEFYINQNQKLAINKNDLYTKLIKDYKTFRDMITSNVYFNYLMDRQNLDSDELPTEIQTNYERAKLDYETTLNKLLTYIEDFSLENSNLTNFINTITTNFETLRKDKRNYDLNTAISQMKLMNFINDPKYLQLMSKYSYLADKLNILNTYEERLELPITFKPEILNIIERLYLSDLNNSGSFNNYNNNNHHNNNHYNNHYNNQNRFMNYKSHNSKSKKQFKPNNRSLGMKSNYDSSEDSEEEAGGVFDNFFNMFKSSANDDTDPDEFKESVVIRADTAEVSSPDIDDNEESNTLIKLEPKEEE